jgi:AraC-like DNA-binding protein
LPIQNTYNLPEDLITGPAVDKNEIIIRHYRSGQDSTKNKIILNSNMINLVISGSKTVVYPQTTLTVQQGELVLLTTGNILTSELISNEKGFESMLIYFSNEILNNFWVKYQSLMIAATPQRIKSPFLIYPQDAFIRQYVQSLVMLLQSNTSVSPQIKQLKIEELLLYIFQQDPAKLQSLQVISKDHADLQLKKAVETHIGLPITIEELAFLCNMSSSTFKRNFNRLYSTSPQQWLLERKLEKAAELLSFPDESPSGVYLKIGYKNHSSFSYAFRQHFGANPSDYQAQHLNVLR